jgi:hypothetical protein
MPDDPRLTIPVLLGTIRAGRRSAHVALPLLGQLEPANARTACTNSESRGTEPPVPEQELRRTT